MGENAISFFGQLDGEQSIIDSEAMEARHHPWCNYFGNPVDGCKHCIPLFEKYPLDKGETIEDHFAKFESAEIIPPPSSNPAHSSDDALIPHGMRPLPHGVSNSHVTLMAKGKPTQKPTNSFYTLKQSTPSGCGEGHSSATSAVNIGDD